MERFAVLQATRRALCLRNHFFRLPQREFSQAHALMFKLQVPSRTITSQLVTRREAPRRPREGQCVLTKDMAVTSCRCLPTFPHSHMTQRTQP